ncbi:MAG: FHA domain-containing protein [Muribaculaceae bacterium]|nr:FHA domain-containing protein [Muribaculaceae bacterium]
MENEYLVGRSIHSVLPVPADRVGVSGEHLKIRVSDDGRWHLEDLNSANGTYIRDDNGEFHRVYSKDITENDIIRLGNKGANSYTFMARRVKAPEDTYYHEFKQLKKLVARQKEEEAEKEKRIEINGWISRVAGLAVIGICALIGSISGVDIDPNTRYILIACAPVVVGLLFSGDPKKLKALRQRRSKIMLCPKCWKPISEYDVEYGQCSRCKAK